MSAITRRPIELKLPVGTERAAVFGRTGSGKTIFLTFLLSHASIETRPWIIIDHKQDEYLRNLPRVQEINRGEIPRAPGVYISSWNFDNQEELEVYLHRIIGRGNVGLFTDEGSSLPQREPRYTGLKEIFAKGRSKRVPVLFATQRPAWLNQSILSESDYFASFYLQNEPDRDRVASFIPGGVEERLDDYFAHWYDVKRDARMVIAPVDEDEALQRLDERLKPKRKYL